MKSLLLLMSSCVIAVLCSPAHHQDHHSDRQPIHQSSQRYNMAAMSLRLLPAVNHEEVRDQFGQYAIRFITAENTVVSERGRLVPSQQGYVLEVEGIYSYFGDDGQLYFTQYQAGVGGFRVQAKHLPKPVPAARIPRIN